MTSLNALCGELERLGRHLGRRSYQLEKTLELAERLAAEGRWELTRWERFTIEQAHHALDMWDNDSRRNQTGEE